MTSNGVVELEADSEFISTSVLIVSFNQVSMN